MQFVAAMCARGVIGSGPIDDVPTSLAADDATRTFHDSDKERMSPGLGNGLDLPEETRRFATRLEALEAAAAHVEAGATR